MKFPARRVVSEKFPGSGAATAALFVPKLLNSGGPPLFGILECGNSAVGIEY